MTPLEEALRRQKGMLKTLFAEARLTAQEAEDVLYDALDAISPHGELAALELELVIRVDRACAEHAGEHGRPYEGLKSYRVRELPGLQRPAAAERPQRRRP
jgi:hypothetical protein